MTLDEELKAMDEIRQLKSRYFRFLDTKDWDSMENVFCKGAVFDLRAGASLDPDDGSATSAVSHDYVFEGVEAIVGFLSESVANVISVHHGHCHEVWIDSTEEARGIIAMEDINTDAQTGELILQGYGHYHETYRREDGDWRIWRSRLSRLKLDLGPGFSAL